MKPHYRVIAAVAGLFLIVGAAGAFGVHRSIWPSPASADATTDAGQAATPALVLPALLPASIEKPGWSARLRASIAGPMIQKLRAAPPQPASAEAAAPASGKIAEDAPLRPSAEIASLETAPTVSDWTLKDIPLPPVRVVPAAPLPPPRPADLGAPAAPAAAAALPPPPPDPAPSAQTAPAVLAYAAPGPAVSEPDPAAKPAAPAAPERAFRMGDPAFVRIFKQEKQLELWLKKDGHYSLYKSFAICKYSGNLGPKMREGDYQSPEGFYAVSARQLHPNSNYHRAFNTGFPNAYDKQNGRTGDLLMVHGDCKSVGCFAMTDRGIEEIYAYVEAAIRNGQREVPVHIFPFRMTDAAIAHETRKTFASLFSVAPQTQDWSSFWTNLKAGYDIFEQTHEPPTAYACGGLYAFSASPSCTRIAGW